MNRMNDTSLPGVFFKHDPLPRVTISGWSGDPPTLEDKTKRVLQALGVTEIHVTISKDEDAPYQWFTAQTTMLVHGEAATKGIGAGYEQWGAMATSMTDTLERITTLLEGWK